MNDTEPDSLMVASSTRRSSTSAHFRSHNTRNANLRNKPLLNFKQPASWKSWERSASAELDILNLLDAVTFDAPSYEWGMTQHAALHAMECISGRQKFDELNIHELQQTQGVYVFGCDHNSRDGDHDNAHPALLAAKSGRGTVGKRTVVYYTDTGVARVIEPKSVKDALNSLQADQWIMAIDAEVANLRSHSAYHLVPQTSHLSLFPDVLLSLSYSRMTTLLLFQLCANDAARPETQKREWTLGLLACHGAGVRCREWETDASLPIPIITRPSPSKRRH